MRPDPRLPAAALVLLLHAVALMLAWSATRPLRARVGEAVELRLIAARPQPSRAAAAKAPPTAAQPPALLPVAVALTPFADPSPAAPPTVLPIETGGAAVVTVVVASPPATLALDSTSFEPPQPARRADCAPATHPPLLRERGIEGLVRLRVWVDELGRASEVLLTASSGFRLFDEAALAQARRCPYEAARQHGRPVASWVEFPIRFALSQTGDLRDAAP